MAIYGEETFPIELGYGLYTSELASNIPAGYCAEAYNVVGLGDSLENRLGLIYSAVNYNFQGNSFSENALITTLFLDDPTKAVLGWPEGNFLCFIRSSNRFGGAITGDNFMRVNPESSPIGSICQYGNITYFSSNIGIRKITAYDWDPAGGVGVTFSSVTTAVTALQGMISFKDRLWGFKDNVLYFSNIATISTAPETWSATTQAIPIQGIGRGVIKKIVPISNRLLIFTTSGLYSLSVQGEPASWIFKTLDSLSFSTHQACAFERSGLIYYVNSLGVCVTDGFEVTRLSSSIEDNFVGQFLGGNWKHTLNFLQDGMVLSIWKEYKSGANTFIDETSCRVFYSRLDIIAWTEWTVRDPMGESLSLFTTNNVGLTFPTISDNVYTALSADPFHFILLTTTGNYTADAVSLLQLAVYDSTDNDLKVYNGSVQTVTEGMHIRIRSGSVDCGNQYKLKSVKYAFAEVFTNLVSYDFDTWWVIDNGTAMDMTRLVNVIDDVIGEGTNLVKIKADFKFRRASLLLHTHLDTVDAQIKFKNFLMVLHTDRNVAEQVS